MFSKALESGQKYFVLERKVNCDLSPGERPRRVNTVFVFILILAKTKVFKVLSGLNVQRLEG